jgi:hypothetical protein
MFASPGLELMLEAGPGGAGIGHLLHMRQVRYITRVEQSEHGRLCGLVYFSLAGRPLALRMYLSKATVNFDGHEEST